jgi:CelD/BcsL family acetyltransferase involved in cellulose biosynthesis
MAQGPEVWFTMAHLAFDPIRYGGPVDPQRVAPAQLLPIGGREVLFSAQIGDIAFEIRPLAALKAIDKAWRALASSSIEANVFHGPAFMLAAQQHLVEASGQLAALVWDRRSVAQPRLLGLWPLRRSRGSGHAGVHKGLDLRLAASGAPLLDRHFAVEAASTLLAGLRLATPDMTGLIFARIALDGPAARALRAAAALGAMHIRELDVRHRPCIWTHDADFLPGNALHACHETARALSRHGDVRMVSATAPDDVRDAVELFLALEASEAARCEDHPILFEARDAAFCRSLTRTLSRDGEVAVHMLEVGDRLAAASVTLTSQGHGWVWRTASDAALEARLSGDGPHATGGPEAQRAIPALLDLAIGQHFAGNPASDLLEAAAGRADTCSWTGHQRVGDLILGVGDDARPGNAGAAMRRALSAMTGWSSRNGHRGRA